MRQMIDKYNLDITKDVLALAPKKLALENDKGLLLNIDYIKKFRNESTFAIGTSYNYTNTDSDTKQNNFDGTNFVEDLLLSNHFIYKENIIPPPPHDK